MLNKPTTCIGCPLYSGPYGKKTGFSYPVGAGTSGVMVVAEALGVDEEREGKALVGKSGLSLFQELIKVGIERDSLTLFNVIACRPPDNKLVGMSYEKECIKHCTPNLDVAIGDARIAAKAYGKTFVIVTLGKTAFKKVMGLDDKAPLLKADYIAYPHWSTVYNCWVYACDHPAYLLRGKTHLWPIVQWVFLRAIEVANNGLELLEGNYDLDVPPVQFNEWINGYVRSLMARPDNPLSHDIETPYKKKKGEDDLGKEDDADHTILRISFAYEHEGEIYTISVKWAAEYMAGIEELYRIAPFVLGWNSDNYDIPRISRFVTVHGVSIDAMVAWHVLNTALPKGLGFVTPFYVQNTGMWKHLSEEKPAFYNAKDSHMALLNFIGIKKNLIENKLWHVFARHVLEINKVLKFMSGHGVKQDMVARQAAEDKLQTLLDGIELSMEESVPQSARKFKVFKKVPKDTSGMILVPGSKLTTKCPNCSLLEIKAVHYKSVGKKKLKVGVEENPCVGLKSVKVEVDTQLWAEPQKFAVSKLGLTNYQKSLRHMAIISREKKVTFNADAIALLVKRYPKDPLYPLILQHRKVQKLLSTYIGVTQYREVEVPDDYELQPEEKWVDAIQK